MVNLTRSVLSLLILTSVSCSSEHKNSNTDAKPQSVADQITGVQAQQSDDATASVLNISELQGSWGIPCVAGHDESAPGSLNSINISNRVMSYRSAIFITALDCNGDADYIAEVAGTIGNGQASTIVPGARNIDIKDRSAKVTVNTEVGAAALNKLEKCGKSDWKKGDIFEPEVVLQPGSNDGKCYKVDAKFTLVKIVDNVMQLGQEDTPYIAESSDTRPVKLSDVKFTKAK